MVRPHDLMSRRRLNAGLAALAVMAGCAGAVHAQSASSTMSGFTSGYNLSSGELTQGVNVATRDANGNKVITDGVTQIGANQSVFSNSSGAVDAFSGAGAIGGAASAIGNNLNVSVSGSYNTVIVNSTQINNGNVSASTVLNGKVNLDGSN